MSILHRWLPVVHDAGMKMLRALFPLAVVAVLGLALAGCSTSYQKAGVTIRMTGVTVGADNTATLVLHLRNENIVPLGVTSTEHKVTFNGASYGKAVGEKPFALKEYGEADHEVKLPLGSAAEAARLKAALASGGLDYRLESRLICELTDETLILTTETSGRVESR
jgi:LEA14-like dessication related protein